MNNRRLPMPEELITAIYKKVLSFITTEEQEKLKSKKGKIVCIDGLWYFLDMGGGNNE